MVAISTGGYMKVKSFIRQFMSYTAIAALINASILAPRLAWADDDPRMQSIPSAAEHPIPQERSYQAPSAEAMALDGLIYRPVLLAATVIGAATFLVTLPISALGGNVDEAAERLVAEPARAMTECLGCLPGQYTASGYSDRQ
jgi:hypothetical protein